MTELIFRVIKTQHLNEADAEIVANHLEGLDVVSLETSYCPESAGKHVENYYRALYDSKSQEEIRPLKKILEELGGTFEEGFTGTMDRIIVQRHLPVMLLERWEEDKWQDAKAWFEAKLEIPKEIIYDGDLETICDGLWEAIQHKYQVSIAGRDRLIAENAAKILPRLTELYPELANKERIVYGVVIGYAHEPEIYLRQAGFKAETRDAYKEQDLIAHTYEDAVNIALKRGKERKDLNDILAVGAFRILLQVFTSATKDKLLEVEKQLLGRITYLDVKAVYDRVAAIKLDKQSDVPADKHKRLVNYLNGVIKRFSYQQD